MEEQKNPNKREYMGLLRILSKETSNILTKQPEGGPVVVRKDRTKLQIIPDDGEPVIVTFERDVGYELNRKRVFYSSEQKLNHSGAIEGILPNQPVLGTYKVFTQTLTPVDRELPEYKVIHYMLKTE